MRPVALLHRGNETKRSHRKLMAMLRCVIVSVCRFQEEPRKGFTSCLETTLTAHNQMEVVVKFTKLQCANALCVRVCEVDLVLELSDLTPQLVDVLPGVGVVELALDQPLLLLKDTFEHTVEYQQEVITHKMTNFSL